MMVLIEKSKILLPCFIVSLLFSFDTAVEAFQERSSGRQHLGCLAAEEPHHTRIWMASWRNTAKLDANPLGVSCAGLQNVG